MTLGSYLLFAAGSAAGAGLAWAAVRQPAVAQPARWLMAGLAAGVLSYLLFGPADAGSEAPMQTKTELTLHPEVLARVDKFLALGDRVAAALSALDPAEAGKWIDRLTDALAAAGPALVGALNRIATAMEGGMTPEDEAAVADDAARLKASGDALGAAVARNE